MHYEYCLRPGNSHHESIWPCNLFLFEVWYGRVSKSHSMTASGQWENVQIRLDWEWMEGPKENKEVHRFTMHFIIFLVNEISISIGHGTLWAPQTGVSSRLSRGVFPSANSTRFMLKYFAVTTFHIMDSSTSSWELVQRVQNYGDHLENINSLRTNQNI